jgi:hypothetical protein
VPCTITHHSVATDMKTLLAVSVGAALLLGAGCAQRPASPPHTAVRAQPPDWFHQQVVAARAARQAHQPKTDRAGAQLAYDEVMRMACTQAALAGPGKYPARCDAVLRPIFDPSPTDPCVGNTDDPITQTECND